MADDEEAIKRMKVKDCVFSDFVLCAGSIHENIQSKLEWETTSVVVETRISVRRTVLASQWSSSGKHTQDIRHCKSSTRSRIL